MKIVVFVVVVIVERRKRSKIQCFAYANMCTYAPSEKVQAAVATNVEKKTVLRLRQRLNSWVIITGIGSLLYSIHIHYYYHFECVTHLQGLQNGDRRGARELSTNPKCNSIFIGVDFFFSLSLSIEPWRRCQPRQYSCCSDSSAFKTYRRHRKDKAGGHFMMLNDILKMMIKNNRFRSILVSSTNGRKG